MKICVIGDVHWCENSSIVRQQGNKFSKRLENLIQCVSWAEQEAINNNCDFIVGLGDFFDSEKLSSQEITSLKEISWSKLPHKFIVGNHEIGRSDSSFSSANLFNLIPNCEVYNKIFNINFNDLYIYFLPYMVNSNDINIKDLIKYKNSIIFSHNDISGIQMGNFISKQGFNINDIEESCKLFINGHLHNGSKITEKIYNIGNLSGQNFSENADIYKHKIAIIDTDTLDIKFIENPYAIKFYKEQNFNNSKKYDEYSVVSVYCKDVEYTECFNNLQNTLAYKINLVQTENTVKKDIRELRVDHLEEFKNFIFQQLGNSDIILEELQEVTK